MSFFTGRRQSDTDAESEQASHIGFDTVLSASTVLEGTLKSEGNIRLDGQFTGRLDITGNVLVGETAEINANIEARNISIAGIVRGNISGNKVQLLKTGRIWGDINSNSLTTEEGAFIDGNITMHMPPHVQDTQESMQVEAVSSDEDIAEEDTIHHVEDVLDQTLPDLPDENTDE